MNGWNIKWVRTGWMGENRQINGWMNRLADGMDGQRDGWMDGWTDGWMRIRVSGTDKLARSSMRIGDCFFLSQDQLHACEA